MPQQTTNGKQHHIPNDLSGLNLRSYLDFPPRQVTLEEEVLGVLDKLRSRMCSREEACQAVLRIIGRETEALESAVKRAISPGQLWADGMSSDHE